jgi:hypothetical protein
MDMGIRVVEAGVRVVITEDSVLLREGLTRLLTDRGHDVAAGVGDKEALIKTVGTCRRRTRCRMWWPRTYGCRPRTRTRASGRRCGREAREQHFLKLGLSPVPGIIGAYLRC